jgi:hypothetical protein
VIKHGNGISHPGSAVFSHPRIRGVGMNQHPALDLDWEGLKDLTPQCTNNGFISGSISIHGSYAIAVIPALYMMFRVPSQPCNHLALYK